MPNVTPLFQAFGPLLFGRRQRSQIEKVTRLGSSGAVCDPFGHRWMIQQEIENVSPEEMQKRWTAMLASGTTCPGSNS